ncbi:MAG TPA: UDP-glucose--hexose-1-phosphate uridylyltransferase [Bryobacteraceae bacterium]|nr:UDP-glucose--hexose-1-phosphate uridylyltransferase [Bryobacteraceae bacterium]
MSEWEEHPHRRFNALTGEWILVSPQRSARPWLGQVEPAAPPAEQPYDADCYLCPGNRRAGGARNPVYSGTFSFTNDYPALLENTPPRSLNQDGLLIAEAERGVCRVLCFSPRHDLTMARMQLDDIRGVVDAWCAEYRELRSISWIRHIQIFENRGALMGASNPHPHCQIWASDRIPNEIRKEHRAQCLYRRERGTCLLCHYFQREKGGPRWVYENAGFAAVVPFWAVWPFEVLLISKDHIPTIDQLPPGLRSQLADVLKQITTRYDHLFNAPFPYTMGFHQGPAEPDPDQAWHLHAHFYPPLLRSATVRKFMVGYELLAMPQRDITPEAAAERLRTTPVA